MIELFLLKNRNISASLAYTQPKNCRMKNYLGEFEELVLLTIAGLGMEAYGVSIQQALATQSNRAVSIGSLHSTVTRLEDKGFLKSWTGGATQERGGRSKRYYELTPSGKKVLVEIKSLRDELWNLSKVKLAPSK